MHRAHFVVGHRGKSLLLAPLEIGNRGSCRLSPSPPPPVLGSIAHPSPREDGNPPPPSPNRQSSQLMATLHTPQRLFAKCPSMLAHGITRIKTTIKVSQLPSDGPGRHSAWPLGLSCLSVFRNGWRHFACGGDGVLSGAPAPKSLCLGWNDLSPSTSYSSPQRTMNDQGCNCRQMGNGPFRTCVRIDGGGTKTRYPELSKFMNHWWAEHQIHKKKRA